MSPPISRRTLLGAALITVLAQPALAQPAPAQHPAHALPAATVRKSTGTLPLKAVNATVVAVPPIIKETSVFGTLINTGKTPIVLDGVRAAVADHGMLMVTKKAAGGMLGMGLTDTLTVPAGGRLVLSDTGAHLMLMKLRRPLKVGETLTLTLSAADGRTFAFQATVRRP